VKLGPHFPAAMPEDNEPIENGEAGAAEAKKKSSKKKKKKAASADDDDAFLDELLAQQKPDAPAAAAPAPAEEEEEEEEGAGEGEGGKKKKTKRGKKKKAGNVPVTVNDYYKADEAFNKWCEAAVQKHNKWGTLKPEELLKVPKEFYGYTGYTGDLRPHYVAKQVKFPDTIQKTDYAEDPEGIPHSERDSRADRTIPELEGEELETMREACKLGREVLDIAATFMRVGVTTDEVDRVVQEACLERSIYPSPLNYYKFPKVLCTSVNEVICHGIPDARVLQQGDICNLDISIYHKGFHSDLNETFFIGECDEDTHRVVRTSYQCLQVAQKMIRPGTMYRDLGNAISAEAGKAGCAVVSTYCGHGVGRLFHTRPNVPHYKKNKAVGLMKPGHVFTIEPMINLGNDGGDKTWPDNWTSTTRNGKRSAQFEHTFLVTPTGCEVLTARRGAPLDGMPDYDPAMFQR